MNLLENGIKVVERVLEIEICRILTIHEMHFGFISMKRTIDAVFVFRRLQEQYYAEEEKLSMCFVDLE